MDASTFFLIVAACGQPFQGVPGAAYSICQADGDCRGGLCLEGPSGLHCAEHCTLDCPTGYLCNPIYREDATRFVCLFEHIADCMPCRSDDDCRHPLGGDVLATCVPSGDGDGSFCTSPCESDAECRPGSVCRDAPSGPYCWPEEGGECGCSPYAVVRESWTACYAENAAGTFPGERVCTEDGLSACDARMPHAETCNGRDDDGDGLVDEKQGGAPCDGDDDDACEDGKQECRSHGLVCVDPPGSYQETCNGIDDDCDGTIDEDTLAPCECPRIEPDPLFVGGAHVGTTVTRQVTIRACGETRITGIAITGDPAGAFSIEPAAFPGGMAPTASSPIILQPLETLAVPVRYVPTVAPDAGTTTSDTAVLRVESDGPSSPQAVEVTGVRAGAGCSVAYGTIAEGSEVVPLTNLHLDAIGSVGAASEIVTWRWTVEQPPGSQRRIDGADGATASFYALVVGVYRFRLDVWDAEGTPSCVPWEGEVRVVPQDLIHVEVTWRTPNDPDETDEIVLNGSDVDLHFVDTQFAVGSGFDGDGDGLDDPWFNTPYDCFWFNQHPNWGTFDPLANDDPELDRGDTVGAGPEIVSLANTLVGSTYRVGVHYWSDHSFGDVYATVRVYRHGELVHETVEVRLANLDLWCVADIDADGQVTPCASQDGNVPIAPNYQNPYFISN